MKKTCSKCGDEKELSFFNKHRGKPMGVYSSCRLCQSKEKAKARARDRKAYNCRSLDWYRDNRQRASENTKRWRMANPEMRTAAWDRWYAENREAVRQYRREHQDSARNAHYTAIRRARFKAAVVPWADLEAIQVFYREARRLTRETGERWVVDHVLPLKGRGVCGLHVETNLQVIPYSANAHKGNNWGDQIKTDAGLFRALPDPHKGLESVSGQRGG
jgi:hypothetical protein